MDEENGLLSTPNGEKWDSIHQIFYQGQSWYSVVDIIQLSLFDEPDETKEGV